MAATVQQDFSGNVNETLKHSAFTHVLHCVVYTVLSDTVYNFSLVF